MENVNQVADYIILFLRNRGENITNLKLQKLLYYTQAWNLALNDARLFDGNFQAWTHGPVNQSIYNRFRTYRWAPITEEINEPNLSVEAMGLIDAVLEAYGGFGGYELERLTHSETPWQNARNGIAPDVSSNRLLSEEDMKNYYRELQRAQGTQEATTR